MAEERDVRVVARFTMTNDAHLGRARRFHSRPQRVAMGLRDGGCTAVGCDPPPGACHAHHEMAWSRGGATTVREGRLLCPRHHTLAHDQRSAVKKHPAGKISFVLRN